MTPTRTARSKGANQSASWQSSTRPRQAHHDDWYLIVRSYNKWIASDGDYPYSVSIAMEAERSEELYVELEAELQARLRIRV